MVRVPSQPSAFDGALPECPVCHSVDRIEKASSVVRRNSGQAFIGETVSYRFTSTIASEFATPPPPAAPTWASTGSRMLFSLIIAALVGLAYVAATEIGNVEVPQIGKIALIAVGVWFGVLVPVKMAFETAYRRKVAETSIPAWREATSRWENLYYCVRDDVGFVKGSQDWRTPDRVRELLFPPKQPAADVPANPPAVDAVAH